MIDWHAIDTVLLDMDGTLLDLHFDNYFWSQHLPLRYVELYGGELETVRRELLERIMSERGTLNWYSLDYWSEQLAIDIVALKHEIAHLIAIRPFVTDFLQWLAHSEREVWLVTNSHRKGLDIKLERTGLDRWLDHIVVSHDLALPKEDPRFWQRLARQKHFDPARSLLVDDTASVLAAAAQFGIRHLLTLRQPDSRLPPRTDLAYPAIHHFDELLPSGDEVATDDG